MHTRDEGHLRFQIDSARLWSRGQDSATFLNPRPPRYQITKQLAYSAVNFGTRPDKLRARTTLRKSVTALKRTSRSSSRRLVSRVRVPTIRASALYRTRNDPRDGAGGGHLSRRSGVNEILRWDWFTLLRSSPSRTTYALYARRWKSTRRQQQPSLRETPRPTESTLDSRPAA
jgi:hypothetical protein